MPFSAGSQVAPPFISDDVLHRRAIAQWMATVQPTITAAGNAPWIVATSPPYYVPNDGSADATPALSAAAATFTGNEGGVIILPPVGSYLLATSLTLPRGVTLKSGRMHVGTANKFDASLFNQLGGRVLIDGGAVTINLNDNTGLEGLLILQRNVALPVQVDSTSFTGIAVTVLGDDAFIRGCFIGGFTRAIYGTNVQRTLCVDNLFDNTNNIRLDTVIDIAKMDRNHAWPFLCAGGTGGATSNHRLGTSFDLRSVNDWAKLTDNFCYGYQRGYQLIDVANVTLMGCGADNTQLNSGSIGFEILGQSPSTQLIGCQAAAQDVGLQISTSPQWITNITNFSAWGNALRCIQVNSGIVHVENSWLRSASVGIATTFSANGALHVSDTFFDDNAEAPVVAYATTSSVEIVNCRIEPFLAAPVSAQVQLPGFSVSSTVSPSLSYHLFNVVGTGTIDTILGGWAGRELTLFFNAATVTIKNGTGTALNGGVDFSATADASLTLIHNGSKWVETSRKN